jgi:hypothetical protein
MSQIEEIGRLKEIGKETTNCNVVNIVIDNLIDYGPKAIPAISEIVECQENKTIRLYGMEAIKKIKQRGGRSKLFHNFIIW